MFLLSTETTETKWFSITLLILIGDESSKQNEMYVELGKASKLVVYVNIIESSHTLYASDGLTLRGQMNIKKSILRVVQFIFEAVSSLHINLATSSSNEVRDTIQDL